MESILNIDLIDVKNYSQDGLPIEIGNGRLSICTLAPLDVYEKENTILIGKMRAKSFFKKSHKKYFVYQDVRRSVQKTGDRSDIFDRWSNHSRIKNNITRKLKNLQTKTITLQLHEIMEFLFRNYGRITPAKLREEEQALSD